jgi:hypothetical protein
VLGPFLSADTLGDLEAIHASQPYVEQDDGEILLGQQAQGFFAGTGLDQILAQRLEDHFQSQQIGLVVINEQDVDLACHVCVVGFVYGVRKSRRQRWQQG